MSKHDMLNAHAFPAVVAWNGGTLRLLDQTRLPAEETYLDISRVADLEAAILRLSVRGAPAIGCAAAFGVVLIAREVPQQLSGAAFLAEFAARCEQLVRVRPTAVNLQWAVARCRAIAEKAMRAGVVRAELDALLSQEAAAILDEDREMCAAIGRHGAELLARLLNGKTKATLMTHCNAGALATGGMGTALAVMYAASEAGLGVEVFADETRPLLQGARLTSWELARAGIPVTVICDNMAASVLRDRKPDMVVVGADRIAANGDTANKIGTYGLAILARHHGVPFYVAAPYSTFDLSLGSGAEIPIEERKREEISEQNGRLVVPGNAAVFNPAFDVTPAALIAGFITERGVLLPPFK
jgi:methylthioribose-1-phosphate isomerase